MITRSEARPLNWLACKKCNNSFVQLISQLIQSMVQALIRVCGVDGR